MTDDNTKQRDASVIKRLRAITIDDWFLAEVGISTITVSCHKNDALWQVMPSAAHADLIMLAPAARDLALRQADDLAERDAQIEGLKAENQRLRELIETKVQQVEGKLSVLGQQLSDLQDAHGAFGTTLKILKELGTP